MNKDKKSDVFSIRSFLSNKNFKIILTILVSIYFFICSLEGVKAGFKLIFAEWQNNILGMIQGETASVTGLALGMLSTALVQSSSAVVAATMESMSGMVENGLLLEEAIVFGVPMILGANIGTTVTNTIVAFRIKRGMTMREFKDTIPGVIVDDVYEGLTIALFFILEMTTGFISKIVITLRGFYTEVLKMEEVFAAFDKTIIDIIIKEPIVTPIKSLFVELMGPKIGGLALFFVWFIVIILSMGMITKGLENLIEAGWERRVSAAFEDPFRGFFTGFGITFLVGSSSIGSSLVIPFLATKVVNLKKSIPLFVWL